MTVDFVTLRRRLEVLLRELSGEESAFICQEGATWYTNSERTVSMFADGPPARAVESLQLIRMLLAPIGDDEVVRRGLWEACRHLLTPRTAFAMAHIAVDMKMVGVIAGVPSATTGGHVIEPHDVAELMRSQEIQLHRAVGRVQYIWINSYPKTAGVCAMRFAGDVRVVQTIIDVY